MQLKKKGHHAPKRDMMAQSCPFHTIPVRQFSILSLILQLQEAKKFLLKEYLIRKLLSGKSRKYGGR